MRRRITTGHSGCDVKAHAVAWCQARRAGNGESHHLPPSDGSCNKIDGARRGGGAVDRVGHEGVAAGQSVSDSGLAGGLIAAVAHIEAPAGRPFVHHVLVGRDKEGYVGVFRRCSAGGVIGARHVAAILIADVGLKLGGHSARSVERERDGAIAVQIQGDGEGEGDHAAYFNTDRDSTRESAAEGGLRVC